MQTTEEVQKTTEHAKFSLMEMLGPAPSVEKVAEFFGEHPSTTYRKVYEGKLDVITGFGRLRICPRSIERFLSKTADYKPRARKAQAR